jgi:O-methyltransferase involved in polyketide biosynthesis
MATPEKYVPKLTGVAETLTITLYARCAETKRTNPIIRDDKAVEIAERLDYDLNKYASGWTSQLGCTLRIKTFDELVSEFLVQHPDALIINLGVGLCTRFARVDNGRSIWYEVDFPEVIQLRQKLMPESERQRYIASSILDFSWIDRVEVGDRKVLIIAEGVCPYLTESENKALFTALGDRFGGAEFIFDMLNTKLAKSTKTHDTVSKTNAEFKFGIDRVADLETWGENYQILTISDLADLMSQHTDRMPVWARIIAPILTKYFKNSARSIKLKLG